MSELVETAAGLIPKTWTIKPLAETTIKIQDGTHFSPQTEEGPCRYVTSKNVRFGRFDLTNCGWISQHEHDAIFARCDVKFGDVLLTKDGANTGNACLNNETESFSLLSSVAIIRTDGVLHHSGFILQYLLSPTGQKRLKDLMSGNAIPRLTLRKIKAFTTPVPSPIEQQRIAEILGVVDEAIEQTEALIAKQQQVKAGLMHDLFTRGVTPDGHLRPTRDQAPNLYQESPLGWIPKEWDAHPFASVMSSSFLGTTVRGVRNAAETVPLIKMGNLTWGELNLTDVERLARPLVTDERHWLCPGDFLFNTRNTPELVGKTAVYRGEFERCSYDNNLLRVRFKGDLDSRFVCQYMSHGIGQQRVFAMATGTTSVAAIYWSALAKFLLPVPKSPTEAAAIADRVDALRQYITAETAHLTKLLQQKQGLMQDLLTGRVPVKIEAKREIAATR